MAERVDLQQQADLEAFLLAQLDQPIEDRLPVAVARIIVVGDEEAGDVLLGIGAHDAFDIVGGAIARLAALHVDDGAEAALERTAAAGIEARIMAGDARHHLARQHREGRRRHVRRVLQIIVDRLCGAARHVAQEVGHAAFAFAGIEHDAEIECLLQFRRDFRQHRDDAADMEAADRDRDIGLAELAGDIERARILIGLNADQRDEAAAGLADVAHRLLHVDDGVALVIGFDLDIDIGAERERFGAFAQQAIDAGQAVGRNGRAPPLDHIAVGVVMRRLDQDDLVFATRGGHRRSGHCGCGIARRRPVAWPFAQKTRISGPAQATIEHSPARVPGRFPAAWSIRSRDGKCRRNWCRSRRPSRSAFRSRHWSRWR